MAGGLDAGVDASLPKGRVDVVPPVFEDIEHMCALLTSCEDLPIADASMPKNFATCVRTMSEELTKPSAMTFSLTLRECGLKANACTSLRACLLRGADPTSCVGRGKKSPIGYCDPDGRALTCFREKIVSVRDCPRGGEQCAVQGADAMCTLGPCKEGKADAGSAGPYCSASGSKVLRCEKGKLVSMDCTVLGLSCTEPGAACAKKTVACTSNGGCAGNVSSQCVRGQEVRIDCGAGGWSCGGPGKPVGACMSTPVEPERRCDTEDEKCEGATIRYCHAGRKRSYFCKSLGFGKCGTDANGPRCQM